MKKILLFLLLTCTQLYAQNKQAEKFAAAITPVGLKEKLSVIASAVMEGRETASEGQRKAAAFIEDYFKKLKLVPGNSGDYQMFFPVYQDSLVAASFSVNGKSFRLAQDFSNGGNTIANGNWDLDGIVFAGDGRKDEKQDDYKNLDINGKWVMMAPEDINENYPWQISGRINTALANGAAGVLFVSPGFPRENNQLKSRMYNQPPQSHFPVIFISKKIAETILDTTLSSTTQHKLYPAKVDISFIKKMNLLQSTNVIGVLPGTDKKSEYVFITAHYDHLGIRGSEIYYGADDDGSGTASVLQIAQAFASARDNGYRPGRTIVFMTVSGEEKGLWGSEYYTNHPLFPLDSTSVDLNIDMIGRIDPERNYGDSLNYVYSIGDDKLSSDLRKIEDSVNNTYTHLELDRKFNDPNDPNRFYYRSDHYNFAGKGVPIIFFFNGTHADYHKPTDTVDKINFDLMSKRAKLVFYLAWDMANRKDMLKRDIPLNQK